MRDVACRFVRFGVRWLCRGVLRLLRIDVHTVGQLPPGPALLVANHLSWIDIVAMVAHYDCTFVAKSDVREWPLVGALGEALGVIWIDRRRKRDLRRAVTRLSEALQNGRRVVLFPEGTTSTGRQVLPFRSSLLEAAVVSGVPVVPMALSTYAADGQGETLCWVGDETLLAHLPRVAALRQATFEIRILTPMAAGPSRKVQSAGARAVIVTARRLRLRRQPAVGNGVSFFAKQNFRPIESSEREIAR
ncbi:lysophospholipid acyltransferase family protein [Gemmatimonas groenlandica]|uniref:1-acyl-sn-glycerol-3-phosphate acyltransferase n=1 Tax=Gemmatimonas groenlandica TaxID=2732249 RepID=A0A6M4ISI0_9BACT|nr:lysophospholipid acyltransferase family protein [Gemmatimonas groenlandica]QJR37028.1 1-acyl-sn-glycerol-3-phosphate acyltransferase [Gemmatimonas groenlandica]